MSSGSEKCPGEANHALAGIGASAGPIASGDRDQVGPQRLTNDVAGVELERIIRGARLRQNDSGVERAHAARGAVRNEVNVGKALRLTGQICGRSRLLAGKYLLLSRRKMLFDDLHLGGGLPQLRIIRVWR